MDFTKKKTQKRKSVDKPLCKYGSSCYQKNTEHHKKFKHPPDTENKLTKDVNENSLHDAPVVDLIEEIEPSIPEKSEAVPDKNIADAIKIEETVGDILKSMPRDFFDFWTFCRSINKTKPQNAFSDLGYQLVGTYDLLAENYPQDRKVDISCHWRYYYDPPEFQTVIKKEGKALYHIGYFRDDPSEKPTILAANSVATGEKLTLMGDNIFCAMKVELEKSISEKSKKVKASKLLEKLQNFSSEKKYSLLIKTSKTKQRQNEVVAKTFHGLGIIVPVKNGIGYRPLPDSDASMKSILKKIIQAENDDDRLEKEEALDEIISNVHFANDECDYGMGLEFGIDLFCFGDPYFHKVILMMLTLAYELLKRPKYASIVKAHLQNRKKSGKLSTIKL